MQSSAPMTTYGDGSHGAARHKGELMTRDQWIAGLREQARSQGIAVTDEMLRTADDIYDAIEQWKAAGFSEEDALLNFAWMNERVQAGDPAIALATANDAAELLELLKAADDEET